MNSNKKIIETLLKYRNYKITEKDENRFIAQNNEKFIIVIFSTYPNLNIEGIKEYLNILNTLSFTHMIIVYNKSITSSSKKIIKTIKVQGINIEVFQSDKLVDISVHRLFRPHEKITGDEDTEIREKYGNKLPKILTSDAMVRWYGFQIGDILRITRKDGHIAYRLVT